MSLYPNSLPPSWEYLNLNYSSESLHSCRAHRWWKSDMFSWHIYYIVEQQLRKENSSLVQGHCGVSTECWAPPNWMCSETFFKRIKTHVFPYTSKSSPIFYITNFCIYICLFERGSKRSIAGKSVLGWWWPTSLIDLDPFIVIFPNQLTDASQ